MSKIECPHCGHWQEARPHVILCDHCYANIKDTVDAHFREDGEEPTEARDQREGRRLSGPGVIFRKTFGTFASRFWALFPLMYLSISFFMLIGIFLSVIGVQTFFPDEYPADRSMTPAFALGIIACLFVFLYAQAGFIFALSHAELSLGDALARALQRFVSYVALVALIAAGIGLGTSMLLIPGVMVGILFSFAPFVFARENAGLISALSKSVRYVAKSWLHVVLRLAPVALVVLCALYFYVYIGVSILMLVRNEFIFIFVISGVISLPVMLITIFVFTVYEDLAAAALPVPLPESIAMPSEEGVVPGAVPRSTRLSPFTDLLRRSWGVYKKRFVPLTILNLVSYLPHAIHIMILLVAYLGLRWFFEAFQATGEFGLLIFLVLPKWLLALFVALVLIYFVLYVLGQIFGLVLYLALELAYVYAVADETIGAWGAIMKARTRLRGFFWAELYRNFIVSTGWALLVPGAVFWTWYQFTPYVFALQREEGTPLSSLSESRELVRGLWGTVFKDLISLRFLPIAIVVIVLWFVFAGLPFYWLFGTLLFFFTGHHLPGMLSIYSPHFWLLLYFCFFIPVGGFYLPFQKVVMYVLYRELKDVQTARDGTH
jgi:hypothetical protein